MDVSELWKNNSCMTTTQQGLSRRCVHILPRLLKKHHVFTVNLMFVKLKYKTIAVAITSQNCKIWIQSIKNVLQCFLECDKPLNSWMCHFSCTWIVFHGLIGDWNNKPPSDCLSLASWNHKSSSSCVCVCVCVRCVLTDRFKAESAGCEGQGPPAGSDWQTRRSRAGNEDMQFWATWRYLC